MTMFKKALVIILAGCAALLFVYTIRFFKVSLPTKTKETSTVSTTKLTDSLTDNPQTIGIPTRIIIPSINVDAGVEQVGITADGFMDVPQHPFDTAWYKMGPRPGENGSAVIDGHVDGKDGTREVFSDLHNLKPGDEIRVQDDQGANILFVVNKSRVYDSTAQATDIFASNDGKAHLNLITCEGVWNKDTKDYSQRLVVFTDKKE